MRLKLAEIIELTNTKNLFSKNESFAVNVDIQGISTDSRKLKKGELF